MHGVHSVLESSGAASAPYGLIVYEVALVFPVAEAHSVNAMPGAPGFPWKSFYYGSQNYVSNQVGGLSPCTHRSGRLGIDQGIVRHDHPERFKKAGVYGHRVVDQEIPEHADDHLPCPVVSNVYAPPGRWPAAREVHLYQRHRSMLKRHPDLDGYRSIAAQIVIQVINSRPATLRRIQDGLLQPRLRIINKCPHVTFQALDSIPLRQLMNTPFRQVQGRHVCSDIRRPFVRAADICQYDLVDVLFKPA